MSLTAAEKCAGRYFREKAESVLSSSLDDFPESAPCSPDIEFYRHECREQEGRTRSVRLKDAVVTSGEIWVTASEGKLRVISPDEAEQRVAAGEPVEFETVLAGKFTFAWKSGACAKCGLRVISREGILRDARPSRGDEQRDLASFSQEPQHRGTAGVLREHQ